MPRYYFDLWKGDEHLPDDEGTELPGPDAAKAEISGSIAELSKGVLLGAGSDGCDVRLLVRDDTKPLIRRDFGSLGSTSLKRRSRAIQARFDTTPSSLSSRATAKTAAPDFLPRQKVPDRRRQIAYSRFKQLLRSSCGLLAKPPRVQMPPFLGPPQCVSGLPSRLALL